jgi:hypothetical protein
MILKVAKSGGNIYDPVKDLAFDTSQNYIIILGEYSGTVNSSGQATISHGLGYIPSFFLYSSENGNSWTRKGTLLGNIGSYADSSNIYINGFYDAEHYHLVIWANSYDDSIGTSNNNAFGKLKIAKPGYDATTATDLRQFVFVSGRGLMIIKEKKQISIEINASLDEYGFYSWNQTISYAHGLGYTPQVHIFASDGSQLPAETFFSAGGLIVEDFSIDDTYLKITTFGSSEDDLSGTTLTYNSHIFFNKIA